uniref:Large ribosomal subunit protein P2 n=1 Tax=Xenopus tropicalis TaxID=8364 RepID=A0A803JZQ7_XENTR
MRYVAAYLLAVLGGKTSPSANDIKSILKSVGIDADDERVKKVISELSGKDLEDVVNSGLAKLSSVPSGGAVSAAPASAPAAGGAAPAEKRCFKRSCIFITMTSLHVIHSTALCPSYSTILI